MSYISRLCTVAVGFALVVFGLSACTETVVTHGQVIDSAQIQRLQVGNTKEDVRRILGSPSATGTFHEDRWYYITETTSNKPLSPNVLTERGVYIVEFDPNGIVSGIRQLDKDDGKNVEPLARVTPTQGQSLGVMDQLLDNLGAGF